MTSRHWAVLAAAVLIAACTTKAQLVATGGSQSDGTMNLSYEYAGTEAPKPDMDGALKTASQRCQGWGFTGAQAFGGEKKECIETDAGGACKKTRVTIVYQCTGTHA